MSTLATRAGDAVLLDIPGELLEQALGVAAEQASLNTRRAYAAAYRQLTDFATVRLGGRAPLPADVDRDLVVAFCDALAARGAASSTLSSRMAAVRRLAEALDLDPRIQRVKTTPGASSREVLGLTPTEYESLLRAPDRRTTIGLRDTALLALLGDAGLRRSEAVRLNIEDVVEHARQVDGRARAAVAPARTQQTRYAVRVRDAKGGKSRTIPLSRTALEAVAAYFKARPTSSRDDERGAPLLVTLTSNREPARMRQPAVAEVTARHAAAARLPEHLRHPHVLHHTFCTQLAERGVPVELIRDLAGHEDVRTALQYVSVTDRRRAQAIADTFDEGRSPLARLTG